MTAFLLEPFLGAGSRPDSLNSILNWVSTTSNSKSSSGIVTGVIFDDLDAGGSSTEKCSSSTTSGCIGISSSVSEDLPTCGGGGIREVRVVAAIILSLFCSFLGAAGVVVAGPGP